MSFLRGQGDCRCNSLSRPKVSPRAPLARAAEKGRLVAAGGRRQIPFGNAGAEAGPLEKCGAAPARGRSRPLLCSQHSIRSISLSRSGRLCKIMEPENLDIESISEARRHAIEQTIKPIGMEELKSLGEKSSPFSITLGGRHFSNSSRRTAAARSTMLRPMISSQ